MKKEERNICLITIFLVLLIWILSVLVMKQEVKKEKEIYRLERSITAINGSPLGEVAEYKTSLELQILKLR